MTAPISRAQVRDSYLAGERLRAREEGKAWSERDERNAGAAFDQFFISERYEALGATSDVVEVGARILNGAGQFAWEKATPKQKDVWRDLVREVLHATRDIKAPLLSKRSHGTREKYNKDGCRCGPCEEANAGYRRDLEQRNKMGEVPQLVPGARSRQAIGRLRARRIPVKAIADFTGIGAGTLDDIMYGRTKAVFPETERALIEAASSPSKRPSTPDPILPSEAPSAGEGLRPSVVPAKKLRTLINDLRDRGFTSSSIAKGAGVSNSIVSQITTGDVDRVRFETHEALMTHCRKVMGEWKATHRMNPKIRSEIERRAQARLGRKKWTRKDQGND